MTTIGGNRHSKTMSLIKKIEDHHRVRLIPVETRSRRTMYRIDRGMAQLGFVEKFHDDKDTTNPWKAYHGIGANNTYLGAFYANEGGLNRAVEEVLK